MDSQPKTLNIFDFDGTVFRSPVPNPNLWDSSLIGKIKSTVDSGGLGWFQDIITLSEPYVPLTPGEEWFIEHVKLAVIQSMNDPNCITVLLTGRNQKYKDIVLNLIQHAKLIFDHYLFKPYDEDEAAPFTMSYKQEAICELVRQYNPTHINIWEDRPTHVGHFRTFLKKMFSHLSCTVILVDPPGETYLPLNIEIELMLKLRERSGNCVEWEEQLLYTAVVIDEKSKQLLRENFPPIKGWTEYYHHMTICLGSLDSLHRSNFPKREEAIGNIVKLQVLAFAKTDAVFSLLVSGYPSINQFPHITLCVAPGSHPKDSNFIKEWTMLETDLIVTGQVTEVKRFQLVRHVKRIPGQKKIQLGKLIVDNTSKKGKNISSAIETVTKWMEENNVENTEENTDRVLEYIKEHFS